MEDQPQSVAKITAALIGKSVIALESTTAQFGLSRTDVVNRALQAYALLTALENVGGEIYVRETPGAALHRMVLTHRPESIL